MNTITVEYNPNNEVVIGLIDVLSKIQDVQVRNYTAFESPYDHEFVNKIQRSMKSKGKSIKLEDLWK
jgi:hypothetical protein